MNEFVATPIITCGIAASALAIGYLLKRYIKILNKFCIPAPVIGGLLFAILNLILYKTNAVHIIFDTVIKDFFMVLFFAGVGLTASFKTIKQGGLSVLKIAIVTLVIILSQNFIALGIGKGFGWDYHLSLAAGSMPFIGGHGTVGSFGPILDKGLGNNQIATSFGTICATFGLIIGSLIGAPIAAIIIKKKKFKEPPNNIENKREIPDNLKEKEEIFPIKKLSGKGNEFVKIMVVIVFMFLCAATGEGITLLLKKIEIKNFELTFPAYIGALFVGIIARNISDAIKHPIPTKETQNIGYICLTIFLSIAMVSLQLWDLEGLGLQLFVIIFAQTIFVVLIACLVVYNLMGKNYDATIYLAAVCGYALGATPNAMSNMQTITAKYGKAETPSLVIPVVGSFITDIFNTLILTGFINILPLIVR